MPVGYGDTLRAMQTFAERLKQAMEQAGVAPPELARHLVNQEGKLGVSRQAVYLVLSGSSKALSAENVVRAARRLDCDAYWLATGEGQPRRAEAPAPIRADPISELGRTLASVPAAVRPALAQTISGWVSEGGATHYEAAVRAILDSALRSVPHGKRARQA